MLAKGQNGTRTKTYQLAKYRRFTGKSNNGDNVYKRCSAAF